MKRDYGVYLEDVLESIARIEEYSKGLSFEEFSADTKVVDATIRNFEIIGEAVKHISQTIKKQKPDVPWKEMAGMRDKLIHEYFGVNKKILWRTAKEDLPVIKIKIQKILDELDRQMRLK